LVIFASNPTGAITANVPDYSGKKNKHKGGWNNKETNDENTSSSAPKYGGFPHTSRVKDTMRPKWPKNEHVHFAIKTHNENGDPFDFAGAQLHITLFDTRTSTPLGSYCLNLAHLILISREEKFPSCSNEGTSAGPDPSRKNKPTSKGFGLHGNKGLGGLAQAVKVKKRRNSRSDDLSAGTATRSAGSKGTGKFNGYRIVSQPSDALMYATTNKFAIERHHNRTDALPHAVQKAADSLQRFGEGATKMFDSLMHGEFSLESNRSSQDKGLEDFGITSLRVCDSLIEGGIVIGQIKCSIDIWWMGEDDG